MILDIDVGNTALKWRSGDSAKGSQARAVDALPQFENVPTRVRVVSVASDEDNLSLVRRCRRQYGVEPEFACVAASDAGVINAYVDFRRLGADRWLAMLAARQDYEGAFLVADCGSALTLDFVAADGRHIGGHIIPGRRMMEAALRGGTGRVRFEQREDLDATPGQSTSDCVSGGIAHALVASLLLARQWAAGHLGQYRLIITGGDAKALVVAAGIDPESFVHRPDLVLDGLSRVSHFRTYSI